MVYAVFYTVSPGSLNCTLVLWVAGVGLAEERNEKDVERERPQEPQQRAAAAPCGGAADRRKAPAPFVFAILVDTLSLEKHGERVHKTLPACRFEDIRRMMKNA